MIPEEEEEIHEALAPILEEQSGVKKSYTGENLGRQGAANWMEEWFDITGFRTHEIDVLLVRTGHKLEAIEVKYFKPKSEGSDRDLGRRSA